MIPNAGFSAFMKTRVDRARMLAWIMKSPWDFLFNSQTFITVVVEHGNPPLYSVPHTVSSTLVALEVKEEDDEAKEALLQLNGGGTITQEEFLNGAREILVTIRLNDERPDESAPAVQDLLQS